MTAGFVYIIESPSATDLLDGRTEGRALGEAPRLADIPYVYSLTADAATFRTALRDRLIESWKKHDRAYPIIHLSMHGDTNGIAFTNGDYLSWNDLRSELLPLIRAMPNALLICMSSCFGLAGCRIAMHSDDEPHYWGLVGHPGTVGWSDSAIAYMTFYHLFFKGHGVDHCVMAMKVASGDSDFTYAAGTVTKQSWEDFMRKQLSPPTAASSPGVEGLLVAAVRAVRSNVAAASPVDSG